MTFFIIKGCGTKDGPVANKPCVFPFKYRGTSYRKCTTERNKGKLWCSTEVDAFGDYVKDKWGNCDSNCGKSNNSFVSLSLHFCVFC